MDEITTEPKKRKKRRRLKLKKLNPFRRKYKKFPEDDFNWLETDDDFKKSKKKSRVRNFLSSAVRIITFRSRRKRASSFPISTRGRSRSKYSSTGSLECLVTTGDNEFQTEIKGLRRSYSDSCLYEMKKSREKAGKKKTKKSVKKASMRAAKFMGTGLVHAAGMFQYMSPIAGIPMAVSKATQPKPKSTYSDERHKKYRNYSDMQYAFSS